MSSYFTLRRNRAMNTLSNARPRPSPLDRLQRYLALNSSLDRLR